VKIDPEIPRLFFGDSLRLGQVLTNLGNNAVKFSHEGGTVTLRARLLEEDATHAVVEFAVEDEGIGISGADQEKLFHAFSQVDNSATRRFGGTGLGLMISKKIVGMMGGEVWLESAEGRGSTFFFTARLEKAAGEHLEALVQTGSDAVGAARALLEGKRILVVEDNDMNQELIRELLAKNRVDLSMAANGKEAVDMVLEGAFDAVLMDCHMPVMDGYEATRAIRRDARFENLPIIALTASVMTEDVHKAIETGMNDHIAKPIVPETFYITLAKWLR